MKSVLSAHKSSRRTLRGEDGYVLLTMLLMVSLMIIAATAALPTIEFQVRRDREQEMIHRGVQYSRAIRAYYKKFGRYPTRLEDLDDTNNLRYLRKHYKDPLNKNKDFKLLHYGDPDLKLGGIGGGAIAGATPAGAAMNAPGSSSSAFGGSSSSFGSSSFGGGSGFGNSGVNSSGVFAQQSSGFGGGSNSAFGSNSNSQNNSNQGSNQAGTNSTPGSDTSPDSQQVASDGKSDTSSSGQQVIASGPIVGVESVVKKDTIREFNKKKKYNEWQFIYDPSADRGGLITTPYQPGLQTAGSLQPGQNGQTGTSSSNSFGQSSSGQSSFGQSSFGQSSTFGQSSGFGNNSGGTAQPVQPSSNSQQ